MNFSTFALFVLVTSVLVVFVFCDFTSDVTNSLADEIHDVFDDQETQSFDSALFGIDPAQQEDLDTEARKAILCF